MGKPEGKIETYLIRKSEENGFICRKYVSPSRKGVPDRIVIANGHTVFIELKSETGKLSEIQKREIKRMLKQGADVRVYHNKKQINDFMNEANTWQMPETTIPEYMQKLLQ